MPQLTNALWTRVNDKLGIKCKLDNGEWRTIEPSIKPYFFVRTDDLSKMTGNYQIEKGEFVTPEGEKCSKIIVDFPNEVREMREKINIPTWESDIPFCRRWMVDLDLKCSTKPKILFFDTEVDSRKGFPLPENADQRILCIGGIDEIETEYFITNDDEIALMKEFDKLLDKFDVVVGWHIAGWDLPYLIERCKKLGYRFNSKKVRWLDAMILYREFISKEPGLKLATIGKKVANMDKVGDLYEWGTADRLWKFFTEEKEKLRKYVTTDALIVKRICDKTGLLMNAIETANLSNLFYDDVIYVSRIIDALLLKKALTKTPRMVFPNRQKWKGTETPYKGALVVEPTRGLYLNVLNFDFRSLYPSLIRTFNIGVDTIWKGVGEYIQTKKLKFKRHPKSIFSELLEDLIAQRAHYRKLRDESAPNSPEFEKYQARQFSLKLLSNVCSGVIGSPTYRFYNTDVSESMTLTGKWLLENLINILEKVGLKCIYADTDGVFTFYANNMTIEEIVKKIPELEKSVDNELKRRIIEKFNPPEEFYCIKIRLDSIFTKIFFGKEKKRYIGEVMTGLTESVLDDYATIDRMVKGKRKVVGFELKKGDTPNLLRKTQEALFNIIFTEKTLEGIEQRVKDWLINTRKLLYEGGLDEELIIEKGTRKRLGEYKTRDVHVKVAEKLLEQKLFRPGDSVKFVITGIDQKGRKIGEPVIKGKEFPKITRDGYDYYFNDRVMPCVARILGKSLALENRLLDEFT